MIKPQRARLGAALLGALVLCAVGAPVRAAEDSVYSAADDPALLAAEAEAVSHLPLFWELFDTRPIGYSTYMLKVGLPTADGRRTEFIWTNVLERLPNGDIIVELTADPVEIADLRAGSQVQVVPSQVVDWSYSIAGRAFGQFTTRALFPRMSPDTRDAIEATLWPTPLETDAPLPLEPDAPPPLETDPN